MDTYRHIHHGFFSFLSLVMMPVISTGLLFALLPLLTQLSRPEPEIKEQTQIMIFEHKTQKAPEVRKPQEETHPKEVKKTAQTKKTQTAPKIEMADAGTGDNVAGTIKIGILDKGTLAKADGLFTTPKSLYATAFAISEVDQAPKVLRRVDPQYPFLARRNNIEGKVVLRFVVDSEGNILEPEVTFSEPEGLFDQAAIECILKWKIKPAVKNNKTVDCIANQSIGFTLR